KQGPEADHALATLGSTADGEPIDVLVVAAYGLILPQVVLDAPKLACLNIHGSLLPRWRGAAPIQRAIEAGDAQTGICIMQMEAGLDTGPVGLAEAIDITPQDTAASLHDKLANLGGQCIVKALDQLERGQLRFTPQPEHGITYAEKILKPEGSIDWAQPAQVLHRKLRAFDPFPGCSTAVNSGQVKCFDPDILSAPINSGRAGEVLSIGAEGLVVQTGEGALLVRTHQKAVSRRAPAQQVAQGLGLQCGHVLGEPRAIESRS
ncbi:MAG: methionyl-tRNA formyltransferase, partial [Limnobacter sp.]|nr:methionyl-tRNA formyltransferase [Limnobacter sp.]